MPGRAACGATEEDIGDAGSTRRIALLDRACRGHRQAPFHSGQRRVLQLPLATSAKYLPAVSPCESHANRSFAYPLVERRAVTRTSSVVVSACLAPPRGDRHDDC